ncbi:uncharacterized protein LOC108874488 [Xyrichtys novacula]|uniref:Uncharacterized protein LOC108874488 n=1 Tax=Xyrichtys novacula TaxID=13765 RepID=A0AAV1EIZ8_XYRNO|nr:uncharacterized protein LOC108874488 [Xyrichtys novacula]
MLMSAMYIVMESQFDYSVHDMPVWRRWWCLLLLENNSLNSCGKIFAHWTKECQELIAGKHTPVFSLKRKAEQQDIEVRKLPCKNSIISVGVLQNAHSCMDQHCLDVFGN